MARLPETPSQTAGPYLHIGLAPRASGIAAATDLGTSIVPSDAAGEHIRIEGRVLDGDGAPVTDVLIEVWQADAEGQYAPSAGWSRIMPDAESGIFSFETIKPGHVPGPGNAPQAPHLNLWLVARGINLGLATRAYFSDEARANDADPVLGSIEEPARRETLMALRGGAEPVYCFDIHLQGDRETVFFET